ncbi:hypothetical protein R1flu_002219 [Riccia fluitans]|uniref:CCHC-type domain-containing protein n=1 Tax=Riccia fluitans TaxID=41844 RepID=A0ABD1Y6H7_9MARC
MKPQQKMKKLVEVAEPSLQKNPDMFLERLKEKMRSHQEWENCEEQPPKKQAESESRGAPSRRRGPTEYHGTQPTTGKRPKIDPARGQNLECYGCGERGHPVHACSDNHSKQKVAQILKERKAAYNKPKEKKDYFLVCPSE